MQTSLREIANKAKLDANHKFGNLYGMLNEENLHWCFSQLNKKASPGVDDTDWYEYAEDIYSNIKELTTVLKEKRYKAKLVRRKYIPKIGGKRPLGIPVVADKLLQTAGAKILEAIYEQDFKEYSHGYRRGRGPQDAALSLRKRIQFGRFRWVVDADIEGFFGNIDHEWMIRMLEQRISDRAFLNLIRKWLKAGILEEDGVIMYPVTGTPQGGAISAILANIYLHYALDVWYDKVIKSKTSGDVNMIRFADDFVCCFQYAKEARGFYEALRLRLAKFKLQLSEKKSRLVCFTRFQTCNNASFTFLGFEYRWTMSRNDKPVVKVKTAKKKLKAAISAIQKWIKSSRSLKMKELMMKYRQKLQGHFNYYGVCGNCESLHKFIWIVNRIVFKWLNRRSQRKSYNWKGFEAMRRYYKIPVPRIIAQ